MKRYLAIVTALFVISFSGATFAKCHLEGRVYEEGAVVAGYICDGGNWVAM